jgi:hypothetical protein
LPFRKNDGKISVTGLFDNNINDYYAEHASTYLSIPTPPINAEGGCTHPDVIDFYYEKGGKWNGYRYWMAFTPLPTLNPDSNENPCIVASNDGITWVVPDGGSNPIHPKPPVSYNSDTTLLYKDGLLYVFFRTWVQNPTNSFYLAFKNSYDGINWSELQLVYKIAGSTAEIISPSIIKDSPINYYLYAVNGESVNVYEKYIYRYSSSTPSIFTDNRQLCTLDISNTQLSETTSDKYYIWHINVKKIDNTFIMLLYYRAYTGGVDYTNSIIYMAYSSDGINFKLAKYPLFSKYYKDQTKWDTNFYRCAFTPINNNGELEFNLWYPGWANDFEVYPTFIGNTQIKKIKGNITHSYSGNSLSVVRQDEISTAIQKISNYIFGDDINRADGNINPTPCGVNYTISSGTPVIQSNYIVDSIGTGCKISLTVPLNFELSFDAVNGNGVTSSDGGFRIWTKAKSSAKWIDIADGVFNTKVLKRVSTNTKELIRYHKIFLKTDLNNYRIIWNGPNMKYFINDKKVIDYTFTVSDFVDQTDMDDILSQTTIAFLFSASCGAKIKSISIKQLI